MDCLDRFNRKMQLSGGTLRSENIKNSRELLKATFEDDASFALGIYMWELDRTTYEDQTPIKVRLYGRAFSAAQGWTEKFQTLMDTKIEVGDIIYDSEENRYLICTEVFNIDDIHYQGKFTLCNWMLKWQDRETGRIFEYPCHEINSTQYNSGEKANNVFTRGSSQHQITLPMDKYTVELSTPQRFFLDKATKNPTSFIVSQNDTTSWLAGNKGLVKVTVIECTTDNDKDRPDLGICDYVDINSLKKETESIGTVKAIIMYDTRIIKSGGDSQKFIGKFFDEKGNDITDKTDFIWEVVCDFKDELEIKQFGNCIRIGIDNDEFVDEEFRLTLSDSTGQYSASAIIQIESLL